MNSFQIEQLNEHFYRIIDKSKTACYLLLGKEKAALLDTGIGIKGLREVVTQYTSLPIIVILTHGHLDHIGGAHEFEDCPIYLNSKDKCILNEHVDINKRVDYTMISSKDVNVDEFQKPWNRNYLPIDDYQCFDLGGITIEMIPVPGHTQGMMCPLIKEDRIIIFGDGCGVSVMLLDEHSSNVSDYLNSLINLKSFEEQYDIVYRNHGTFTNQKDLLDNVIECCKKILDGTDDHIEVKILGKIGFLAKEIDTNTRKTKDGKEGNIFYIDTKVK